MFNVSSVFCSVESVSPDCRSCARLAECAFCIGLRLISADPWADLATRSGPHRKPIHRPDVGINAKWMTYTEALFVLLSDVTASGRREQRRPPPLRDVVCVITHPTFLFKGWSYWLERFTYNTDLHVKHSLFILLTFYYFVLEMIDWLTDCRNCCNTNKLDLFYISSW